MTVRVHVAGNAVLDLVVRGRGGGAGPAADGWGANVELLDDPVVPTLGGCGAGPAYVLGRLGQSVSLSSNLVDDEFGHLLTGWLRSAGVELGPPMTEPATAVHIIHVDGAQRRSAYYRGHKVRWDAGLTDELPDWFVATGYGAVDGHDLKRLTSLCESLRGRGVRVMFDPSPWFAGRVGATDMLAFWRHVDVLSATEEELINWMPAAGDGVDLARACCEHGPGVVAVKRGPRGACWATADGSGEVPAPEVVAGNSVGAGDTFNARLVYGLMTTESPGEAVAAAVELASRVVAEERGVLGAFQES